MTTLLQVEKNLVTSQCGSSNFLCFHIKYDGPVSYHICTYHMYHMYTHDIYHMYEACVQPGSMRSLEKLKQTSF